MLRHWFDPVILWWSTNTLEFFRELAIAKLRDSTDLVETLHNMFNLLKIIKILVNTANSQRIHHHGDALH